MPAEWWQVVEQARQPQLAALLIVDLRIILALREASGEAEAALERKLDESEANFIELGISPTQLHDLRRRFIQFDAGDRQRQLEALEAAAYSGDQVA